MTAATHHSSPVYEPEETVKVLPPSLWSTTWHGTSDHLGFPLGCRAVVDVGRTSWATPFEAPSATVAEEVRRLRDRVVALTSLTKQDVARAVGVDRRSLSGYATGEIRPTETRLLALRVLAEAADWAADHYGERARDVLRGDTPEGTPLDLVAAGRTDLRATLEAAAAAIGAGAGPRPTVTVGRRRHRRPLYPRALEQWRDRIDLPSPGGTPRAPEVHDQDLSQAVRTAGGPTGRSRRKRI